MAEIGDPLILDPGGSCFRFAKQRDFAREIVNFYNESKELVIFLLILKKIGSKFQLNFLWVSKM